MNPHAAISIEAVARKLDAMRHGQALAFAAACASQPRLRQLPLWLQWQSHQPGALLENVIDSLLKEFPDSIGPAILHEPGPFTPARREQAIAAFPNHPGRCNSFEAAQILETFNHEMRGPVIGPHRRDKPDQDLVNSRGRDYFIQTASAIARLELPIALFRFCEQPEDTLPDTFYFHGLQGAAIELMDIQAARVKAGIAWTAVAADVWETLSVACRGRFVHLDGRERIGKTFAAQAFARAHPHLCRYFSVPATNDQRSLYVRMADALGLSVPIDMRAGVIRQKLEYIFQHTRLAWIADEFHFATPLAYSKRTAPQRLDFLRTCLVDQRSGLAAITTPQKNAGARETFQSHTGYNLAQLTGRLIQKKDLPSDLSRPDLLAVVRHHRPALPEKLALLVVAVALQSQGYLHTVEAVLENSAAHAENDGREDLTLADIQAGITAAGHPVPELSPPPPRRNPPPLPAACRPPAPVVHPPCETPSRRAATAADLLGAPVRALTPDLAIVK